MRDEEAVISRLSPWLCLWQRDSTVQVRTARNTQWQTDTLYSSATQQNRTNHEGAFLGSQPSVQITAQRDWITPALQPWEAVQESTAPWAPSAHSNIQAFHWMWASQNTAIVLTWSSSSTTHSLFIILWYHASLQYYQKMLLFISLWNTTATVSWNKMTDGGHNELSASCWETVGTHIKRDTFLITTKMLWRITSLLGKWTLFLSLLSHHREHSRVFYKLQVCIRSFQLTFLRWWTGGATCSSEEIYISKMPQEQVWVAQGLL